MSAIDQTSRASSALKKRQESIKKWKDSPTAKEPADHKQNHIKFELGTVFLSAISSGDIDEAHELLEKGVDINYANVDGLTALHQVYHVHILWAYQTLELSACSGDHLRLVWCSNQHISFTSCICREGFVT